MFNHFLFFNVIYFSMIKNIFKGFIIGIGKIIPGVSGSMLAISMGIYERALKIISNIRKARLSDFWFLVTLVIGVFIGISLFSKGVKWALSVCYLPIMLLFTGLILAGIPDIVKEMNGDNKRKTVNIKYIIIFVLSFLFSYFITKLGEGTFEIGLINGTNGEIDFSSVGGIWSLFGSLFLFFIIGLIEAFSSIVPGISGTAIFMSLGCYDLLLSFYENIFNPAFWVFGIFFLAGVIVGILILAKLITFLFSKYKTDTYWAILGFMFASIIIMIKMSFGIGDGVFTGYAFGSVSLKDFIDFDSYYWLSLFRLVMCVVLVCAGYFIGIKINRLLESD